MLIDDLRFGIRVLRRSPGFAAVAILSLALGIGANTAIFSILNALILRPLPVREPDRLVQLLPGDRTTWSHPLWEQLRGHHDLFEGVFAWSSREFDLAPAGQIDPVNGLIVSANFFDALGVAPVLGRAFQVAEDRRGVGPEGAGAVISYGFWQRRFAGAPDVIGKPLSIERVPFTILGVTSPDFFGPNVGRAFDVAIPIGTYPLVLRRDRLDERTWWWLSVMARLSPGDTAQSLSAALSVIQPQMRDATLPSNLRPEDRANYLRQPFSVEPAAAGPSQLRRAYRQPLLALMTLVGVILLISCVNLANLLLARADARRHELMVHLALGASRGRLVRQFLVESLLITSCSAALALVFANWSSSLLVQQISSDRSPAFLDLSLDWRVLGFTATLALGVALLFGTVPALRATHVDVSHALKQGGRLIRGAGGWNGRSALVALQVALCLVLVAAAGVFVQTFAALAYRNTGFDADRVLVIDIDARRSTHPPMQRLLNYDRILDAVRELPGVEDASLSAFSPVSNNEWTTVLENPSGVSLLESERSVNVNLVSPGWFGVYGIRLLAGRDFVAADRAETSTAVIINAALARRYFADRNPIGLTIREAGDPTSPNPELTIVGIASDSVYLSMRDELSPGIYRPVTPAPTISLNVRAHDRSPALLASAVAGTISGIDADFSLRIRTLGNDLGAAVARERLLAGLSGFFGLLALLLAGLGVYGVVSYAVGSRRSEIALRMALGARPSGVVVLVVRRIAVMAGAGLVAGVSVSLWASQFAGSLVYGVSPSDWSALAMAILALVGVAAAASWIPAVRAARVDPATVLREA